MIKHITSFREYRLQFEKSASSEFCYVLCWEESHLKKVCIGKEPLEEPVPNAELMPLSRIVYSLPPKQLPVSLSGGSPTLVRVLGNVRADGLRFVVYQSFSEQVFLQCFRQAHQEVFGLVEVVTIVDYVVQRLKSALCEEWTEDKPVLRKCVLQGSVNFCDYRALLTDLIDMWPSIRPYIRCTGNPEAKEKAASVSIAHLAGGSEHWLVLLLVLLCV